MLLNERYAEKISRVLSCFDRVLIKGCPSSASRKVWLAS